MNESLFKDPDRKPLIGLTMGDPAGIGPEIIAKGWPEFSADRQIRFVVFGDVVGMQRAVDAVQGDIEVRSFADADEVRHADAAHDAAKIAVIQCGVNNPGVEPGLVSALAGNAAFQFIDAAITATLNGQTDAIVTAPINKQAIQMAGHDFPGHTEILAERCGVNDFAMMLYIAPGQQVGGDIGLGVVHTTLHQSLRNALDSLSVDAIISRCKMANDFAKASICLSGLNRDPRIAVAALNPHASENGIFGDEESTIIAPAVEAVRQMGMDCQGPISCDTLMGRAVSGEFDMVVAMYHDQGHIALKLLGMHKAVNVTLGLPIIRTSVAHGTAFEIAGSGSASCASLIQAIAVARTQVAQRNLVVQ